MNKPNKVLMIGGSGLIGKAVCAKMNLHNECVSTYYHRANKGMLQLDIIDRRVLEDIFNKLRPSHVVHCANLSGGLDFCQRNPDLARRFHYDGTVNIGRECQKHNARLIFISSECVFDGKKEIYDEKDPVSPKSIYGQYKSESEEWIQGNLADYIIARTMSVFGWDPLTLTPNALMKVYFSIFQKKKIQIPAYRYSSPTYVGDLANAIRELSASKEVGIFHLSGSSFLSRYDWLKQSADFLGWDSSFLLPQKDISEQEDLRPMKITFDTSKFKSSFEARLHSLQEALNILRDDIVCHKAEAVR